MARRIPIQSLEALRKLPRRSQVAYERMIDVVHLVREHGMSPTKAARMEHTSLRSVMHYGGSAFERSKTGRIIAKPRDPLLRVIRIPTATGEVEVGTRSFRTASTLGKYLNAVKASRRGDDRALRQFRGKSVRVGKVSYPLETNPRVLERLFAANALTLEDLYVRF